MEQNEIVRLKEQLKNLNNKLFEVEKLALLGHWELDIENRTLFWSDELFNLLDIEAQDIEPNYDSYLSFIHPDDKKQVDNLYRKSLKEKKPFDNIHRVLLKNGEIKYVHVKCITEYNREGRATKSFGTIQNVTKQVNIENALRESQMKLSSTISSIDDFMFVINAEGIFVEYYAPERQAHLFPPELFLNNHYKEVDLPKELIINLDIAFTKIVEKKGIHEFDYNLTIEGKTRWFQAKLSPQINQDGKFTGVTIVAREISKRIIIEKALRESQYFLKEAQRVVQIGYYILDIKKNKWTSSELLDEIFGISRNHKRTIELWAGLIHPEDMEIMVEYFQNEVLRKHNKFDKEYRIVSLNEKKTKWAHGKGELEFNDANEPIRMIGTIQDISDRKKAEQELLSTNAKLEAMINHTDDFIMIADKNAIPIMFNSNYKHIFDRVMGIDLKPGIKPHTLLNDEAQNKFWDGLHKRALSGEKFSQTFEFPVEQEIRYFEFNYYPINENDEVIGFVEHSRDITALKKTEIDLINAKEKAEESDRLKSSFLANLSHEIRTPMNGIIGFSEMIKRSNLVDKQVEQYADIIVDNSYQLLRIVDDILDLSRIETNQISVKKAELDLNLFLNDVYNFHILSVSKKGLKFIVSINNSDKNLKLNTDKNRLRQIFDNVISNAIKFTEKGNIEIGFCKKDKVIEFFVKDTGNGIRKELHEKIFDRFHQAESTVTTPSKGVGLGLTISKGLIEVLGGKIWCSSVPNEGSVFYFTVPSIDL